MAISVGIDLGTTFSAVAIIDPQTKLPKIVPNREGGKITPSVIQFIDGKPVFGTEAESASLIRSINFYRIFAFIYTFNYMRYCMFESHTWTVDILITYYGCMYSQLLTVSEKSRFP